MRNTAVFICDNLDILCLLRADIIQKDGVWQLKYSILRIRILLLFRKKRKHIQKILL